MAHSTSKQNAFAERPRWWWTDLLLWLLILAAIGWGVAYFGFIRRDEHRQIISLSFSDANELSKGSIVRMMGTEIGYVSNIKVFQDHVQVTLKTNPGSISIPPGSTFTINFTGLVGSKNIEIIPPAVAQPKRAGAPLYKVEEPIRLKDTLQYQIDIAQALQRGAENFADFFGKKQPVEELAFNIRQSNRFILKSSNTLAGVNQALVNTNRDAQQTLNEINTALTGFNAASREAVTSTQPTELGPSIYQILARLSTGLLQGQVSMTQFNLENRLQQINRQYLFVGGKMEQLKAKVNAQQWKRFIVNQEQELVTFNQMLSAAQQFFAQDRLPQLQQVRQTIQSWNQALLKIRASFMREPAKVQHHPQHQRLQRIELEQ